MKIYYFLSLIFILFLLSCQKTTEINSSSEAYTNQIIRAYSKYGEEGIFMREFGQQTHQISQDTTLLEFCKDSSQSYQNSGRIIRNQNHICYPKEVFISDKIMVNPSIHRAGQMYRRAEIAKTFNVKTKNKNYEIFNLKILLAKELEMKTVLIHSEEYWNKDLGLILKSDEHFARKRRRIITSEIIGNTPKEDLQNLVQEISKDSSSWVTRKNDGSLWF